MSLVPPELQPTRIIDFTNPRVVEFAHSAIGSATAPREQAVRLYYAVRDGFRYDPYQFRLEEEWLSASKTIELGHGWCLPKAILLTACCRAIGIPARVGFADVKNHLATERLLELMGTDVFVWHGYVAIHLGDRWLKATPAFNIEMCRRFDVLPLEFDGTADALMHPFNARQKRHMEYLLDRGLFDDIPHAQLVADMRATYPKLVTSAFDLGDVDFEKDRIHPG